MEVGSYDGEDFHPSIEPMVIINSEEDEEENVSFFLFIPISQNVLSYVYFCLFSDLFA